ncbi:MAG: polysaccharide deacetylase family protein [Clostridium sp.]|nr:polysaccharide deacetylase family protein [Clostridium sp.]
MIKNYKRKRITLLSCVFLIIIATLFIFFNHNTKVNNDNELVNSTEISTEDTDSTKQSTDSTEKNRFENVKLTNEDVGVPVLYYHSVLPDSEVTTPNEVTISPQKLKEELKIVKDLGYTTLTLSELTDYLNNNMPIPEKSIVITFDDGYTDNYVHAFPILKELDMKATIFMIAAEVDNGGYYMSSSQLKEMSDYGIDIASHTDHHVYLDSLSYDKQLKELKDSKEKLEKILGKEVTSIAYPYGNYNENTKKAAVAAGYTLAFTTNKGLAKRTNNKVELNRIYVSSNYSLELFKERLLNTK